MNQYTILLANPSASEYQTLREAAGLSPKSRDAIRRGLSNSLFSVQVLHGENPVGMGRIVGDRGCYYQVVDIAVLPEHHRKGIGSMIMKEIARYIANEIPDTAYVSLIAGAVLKGCTRNLDSNPLLRTQSAWHSTETQICLARNRTLNDGREGRTRAAIVDFQEQRKHHQNLHGRQLRTRFRVDCRELVLSQTP